MTAPELVGLIAEVIRANTAVVGHDEYDDLTTLDGNEDRAIAAAIQMAHENAEQLRARADAATPGPWGVRHDYGDNTSTVHAGMSSLTRCVDCGVEAEYDKPDAEFIAHAREDVPALVAALKAVEAVHVPWDSEEFYNGHDGESRSTIKYYCGTCVDGDERPYSWPCPTITAIREALGS